MRKIGKNVLRYQERCCVWMKMTRIKSTKSKLKNIRLFTDFGGIGFYKIIKIYEWKEYCAVLILKTHYFQDIIGGKVVGMKFNLEKLWIYKSTILFKIQQ